MRNSSLVEWRCAENVPGLNRPPKPWIDTVGVSGRRAFQGRRSRTGRTGGALGSENAGMSSERRVRIPSTECLRFPEEGSSAQGQSGPKSRPKGVDDGQQVDIPVPPPRRLSDGVTQEDRVSALLVARPSSEAGSEANPTPVTLGCDGKGSDPGVPDFTLPRKASNEAGGARTANRHR